MMDADGYKKRDCLHLCNHELLEEIQLLSYYTYKQGTLSGPHVYESGTSSNLNFVEKEIRTSRFGKIEDIGLQQLYTLSVDDDDHSYVSSTYISKNCVALVHMNTPDSIKIQQQIGSLQYHAFDILYFDGKNVQDLPYEERDELVATSCAMLLKNESRTSSSSGRNNKGIWIRICRVSKICKRRQRRNHDEVPQRKIRSRRSI